MILFLIFIIVIIILLQLNFMIYLCKNKYLKSLISYALTILMNCEKEYYLIIILVDTRDYNGK